MTDIPEPNGCCRICHQRISLHRKRLTVRKHRNRYTGNTCEGTGRRPIEETVNAPVRR